MLNVLFLLAATVATPTPIAAPAPALGTASTGVSARPRTLADVARERKLGIKPKTGGFSAAESSVGPPLHPQDKEDKENPYKKMAIDKLGQPEHRNITTTFDGKGGSHVSEQWVYPNSVYVYFRDGVTSAIQR